MVNRTHAVFKANDRSFFAILKKDIHAMAAATENFSAKKLGEIDIIVAELVSNLVKHAGGGQVLAKLVEENGSQGIELIGIDDGPGMKDVSRMSEDGVSTKKTLGQGLGAMRRLSNLFQVYSLENWGTVILIRVFEKDPPFYRKQETVEIRSVIAPKPGEEACGDGAYSSFSGNHIKFFLGDGLGHGLHAAEAVNKAGHAFLECDLTEPAEIIRYINTSVKKTRGLVGTVVVFDIAEKKWRICGVGNIATHIQSISFKKNYTPYNGIIGLNVPNTLNTQELMYEKGQHLIMCSDGLKSKWDIARYPAILRYDPSILSACLIKDYARNTDDMSAMVCKINL